MDFDPRDFDDSRDRTEDLRDRDGGPRKVFTRDLDLPRGREREIVHDRDREYTLRGSEARTLAAVGAFRVVSSRDHVAIQPTNGGIVRSSHYHCDHNEVAELSVLRHKE